MKKLNLIFLSLAAPLFYAFTPVSLSSSSLEWQKIELEKNINQKVVNSISPVIRSGEFIVNTQVVVKSPGELKPGAGGGAGGDNKNKKNKINFNDIDPQNAKGDFVVLSKLGIEAPVYGASDDSADSGKPGSEAKEWQKFLTQYIEVNDLARYVDKIVIDVKLDNYLGEETKKTVEEILNSVSLSFGKAKAEIKLSYIDMKEMKKEIEKKRDQQNREFYEWIGKLGAPVGIIIAVILLGIFALVIFKKYAELHEKQMEMLKNQMMQQAPAQPNKDEEDKKEKEQTAASVSSVSEEESVNGLERFRAILKTSPMEASLMVKKWINEPIKLHQLALKCLVKELDSDELSSLFSSLSMEERKEWKKIISKPSKEEELKEAKKFIGIQVVQEMIIPNTITDHEMIELLLKVKPEDCAELVKEDDQLGSFLLNVMNTKFVSKMLNKLSSDEMQTIIRAGMNLTLQQADLITDDLRAKLKSIVRTETMSPMIEKIMELIPVAAMDKERALYSSLVETGNIVAVVDLAKRNLPYDILFTMPDVLMKNFIQSYPREKRPEIFYMAEDDKKDWIKNLIAPNQKSQDMLSLDLEKYQTNSSLNERITVGIDQVKKDFLDHCRQQIKQNPSLQRDLEPVILNWMESFGVVPETKTPELKMAA